MEEICCERAEYNIRSKCNGLSFFEDSKKQSCYAGHSSKECGEEKGKHHHLDPHNEADDSE